MWPFRAAAPPPSLPVLAREVDRQLAAATSSDDVARAANRWASAARAHRLDAAAVEEQLDAWAAACRTRAGVVRVGQRLHLATLLRLH